MYIIIIYLKKTKEHCNASYGEIIKQYASENVSFIHKTSMKNLFIFDLIFSTGIIVVCTLYLRNNVVEN